MKVHVGVKSDPIEGRYSFDWLFGLMRDLGIERMQYGSSTVALLADDGYFRSLRRKAEGNGILITSLFSSNREFGGFSSGDPFLQEATRRLWARNIHVASLLGARTAGSSASILMRDAPEMREQGIRLFLQNARDFMRLARKEGLDAITTEPLSSTWEYPSTPSEIEQLATDLGSFHADNPDTTVPLFFCGDISHGVADESKRVIHSNWDLFELEIPWMWELHFKNTDSIFNSTFGFGEEERGRGIVDLVRLARMIDSNSHRFPVSEITGYLEIPGPKVGRDYTDGQLGGMLSRSLEALREHF